MTKDWEEIFSGISHHCGDIYVADYTQFAKEHGDCANKGVVISDSVHSEIGSLIIHNPNKVKVLSVNFERNDKFFRVVEKEKCSTCECMFVADGDSKKSWLVLVELKYCKGDDRNIQNNFDKAIEQLKSTFLYLRDTKKIIGCGEYNYFWVVSMPEHSEKIPFMSFSFTQDAMLSYREDYGVTVIGDNELEIWTKNIMRPLSKRI